MASSFIIFTQQPVANGFLPIHVGASNGDFGGSTEASVYADEIKFFADQLATFPRTPGDRVLFSSGGDDDAWQSYLYLEAYLLETPGAAALQVRVRRNEPELQAGGSAFTITSTPAALSRLGHALSAWLVSGAARLEMEL